MIKKLFHPLTLQRAEGIALFAAAAWLYYGLSQPWWVFVLVLVAVDLTMLGYTINNRIGSYVYNAGHTLIAPLAMSLISVLVDSSLWFGVSLSWIAHIGIDRLIGYGLKYPDSFKSTHLQNLPASAIEQENESIQALQSVNQAKQSAKEQRKAEVVAFALDTGQVTNNDVERLVNVSDATATRYLDELESEGKLKSVGEGRSAHYRPIGSNDV